MHNKMADRTTTQNHYSHQKQKDLNDIVLNHGKKIIYKMFNLDFHFIYWDKNILYAANG